MISGPTKLATLALLILACSSVRAESNVQVILELGINRANFDDQLVAGHSVNPEWALAVSYKSIIEFGYTSIFDIAKSSMDDDAGIQSEDGFYASADMFYLRGSFPLTEIVDIFALVGRSKFKVEATSTTGCWFFCGDVLTTWSETNYSHEDSGLALGIGVGFKTTENRQLIIQYVDYNYGGEFEFNAITLGYRWQFNLPI